MSKRIDLHVHSTASDGTLTPTQLVDLAKKLQLGAFALTDHDTIAGLEEAFLAASASGIEVISGIEFSTEYHGIDIHIVGLDFDHRSPAFLKELSDFQDSRDYRNRKIIERLQSCGVSITYEKMLESFGAGVWTRAHFGRYLLENGFVKDISEAFSRYIGEGAPCFVPRRKVTPARAVRLIRKTGGIPVLAHPFQYHFSKEELLELIQLLKQEGLVGIEAFYSTHSPQDSAYLCELAERFDLAVSGGSDFHGDNKPDISLGSGKGSLCVTYDILEKLRIHRDRKALFLDLDGTLFTDDKQFSQKNRDALSKALDAGHKIVIATGRPLVSAKAQAKELGFTGDGCYVIAYNGGEIYDMYRQESLYRAPIPLPLVRQCFDAARARGIHCQTYDSNSILAERETEDLKRYSAISRVPYRIVEDVTAVLNEGPLKLLLVDYEHPERLKAYLEETSSIAEGKLDRFFSYPEYLENVSPGVSKGDAIARLCAYTGIPRCNTVAAGDAENDISMIREAAVGCAMKNAAPEVKAAADYVTENDNNHDGVAEIIERFILNTRTC